jgi:hypothetical protein
MARKAYLSSVFVAIILVVAIVISTGFGSVGIAQGQGNLTQGNMTYTPRQGNVTIGNVTYTPGQIDAICNPNNPLSNLNPVNTTESKICGIPKTVKPHLSNMTTANTTGEEAPPSTSSIAPSANTTTGIETEAPPTDLAPSATPPLDE